MHDMDRTRAEAEAGIDALESSEFQYEDEGEFGFGQGEYGVGQGEYGFGQGEVGYGQGEMAYGSGGGVLSESEETELASQLLEISSDAEMDQFLGNLIRRAGQAVGKFVRSPVGKALGGVLKDAARTALPIVGGALGNIVAPGVGGAIGSQLASTAGSLLGLELEGLSNEDAQFEMARRYVQLAAATTQNAMQAPENVAPQRLARIAFARAARRLAPGLMRAGAIDAGPMGGGQGGCSCGGHGAAPVSSEYNGGTGSGRWYRRGRRIIIEGL
jgi:hypothetical protein